MDPDEYCREKVAIPGSSYYYSTLFLPPVRQKALNALYAFKAEIDEIPRTCSDPGVASLKLQWWRDELVRTAEGTPRHPVARRILALTHQYDLWQSDFLAIINSAETELNWELYPSFTALQAHYLPLSEALARLACKINGYEDEHTPRIVRDLDCAIELGHLVQDIREDAARGRICLPTDELAHYSVSAADLLSHANSPRLRELIILQIERVRQYLHSALAQIPGCDRLRQLNAIIMGEILITTLDEVQRDGYRILEHRIALTPLRKFWIAWRTWRRETKRFRKLKRIPQFHP